MYFNRIACPNCGTYCGQYHEATNIDPSFCEGIGENFIANDGRWCCSNICLEAINNLIMEE